MSEKTIRILITDDHAIVRDGLRLILETEEDFEIVGEACNGKEACQSAKDLHPHVILLDLRMPVMDGIEALKCIHRDHSDIAVVILTTYNEDEMMRQGLKEGALGYLLKDTDRGTLIKTIRTAATGQALFQPEIIQRAMQSQQSQKINTGIESNLTGRELEILLSVAQGNRNKEIAYQLGITERTVKAHLASIYQKLNVDSRAGAIAVAGKQGII
ncbi:MAG: response regulator transcription factor [Anaerolineaceae bacterium]|nr:response regulator transcription factor [Anaerolineaceae bacterium]